ncbi:hypothetical protein, partial [Cobetia sp. MC34]|uniref:hypothetical protein n=1 Tax=Cobetia sp. MC34 TaxID=2785080 RepID=UPI001BCA2A7E
AYQVLHGLRCLLGRQTRQGWSLSRMREQVLKVAATLSLHARRNHHSFKNRATAATVDDDGCFNGVINS